MCVFDGETPFTKNIIVGKREYCQVFQMLRYKQRLHETYITGNFNMP